MSSQQYLKAAQASVLDQLEDIEVQRMHRTLECLDKAMTLGVGLQRQKLAFEWDLARRLRSVSGPHDIESWVATVSKHARSPATNVDHQQEPKVEVDTCAMPAQVVETGNARCLRRLTGNVCRTVGWRRLRILQQRRPSQQWMCQR